MTEKTPPEWAKRLIDDVAELRKQTERSGQLIDDVAELKKQTVVNCGKLDRLGNEISNIRKDTELLPQILEIVQANGNGVEVLSKRVDALE